MVRIPRLRRSVNHDTFPYELDPFCERRKRTLSTISSEAGGMSSSGCCRCPPRYTCGKINQHILQGRWNNLQYPDVTFNAISIIHAAKAQASSKPNGILKSCRHSKRTTTAMDANIDTASPAAKKPAGLKPDEAILALRREGYMHSPVNSKRNKDSSSEYTAKKIGPRTVPEARASDWRIPGQRVHIAKGSTTTKKTTQSIL